jgi:hypothetical protein
LTGTGKAVRIAGSFTTFGVKKLYAKDAKVPQSSQRKRRANKS